MLNGKTVAVVVPAYNEETQIGTVIETMPEFVDRIVIVNDKSKDETSKVVLDYIGNEKESNLELKPFPNLVKRNRFNEADIVVQDINLKEIEKFVRFKNLTPTPDKSRIILLEHQENGGVGAAIAQCYKWCKDHEIDCTAVMAGDGQMDPGELEEICLPVIEESIDYVKGNRLGHPSSIHVIPKVRFLGNSVLSILTKIASGYWRVSDTQTGYTAISKKALNAIELHKIYKSYGMPNDTLVKLNIANCTLREIIIKPVYRVGEQSKMKIFKVIPRVSWLLTKSFFKRVWLKYFLKDFHPLFLFYHFSFILLVASVPYGLKILKYIINNQDVSFQPVLAFMFLSISAFQALTFAMWMDIQDNERLEK